MRVWKRYYDPAIGFYWLDTRNPEYHILIPQTRDKRYTWIVVLTADNVTLVRAPGYLHNTRNEALKAAHNWISLIPA